MKNSHPEIAWKDMAGMRDKLIHDYFGVDIEAVYLTVTKIYQIFGNRLVKLSKKREY